MKTYIWQQTHWPHFTWDSTKISKLLRQARKAQAAYLKRISGLSEELKESSVVESITDEVCDSNKIEGELLNRESVRSSLIEQLGVTKMLGEATVDRHVEGVVSSFLDAISDSDQPLSEKTILAWHAAMFPAGYSGFHKIDVAQWRTLRDVAVVSGKIGRQNIHYEAPPGPRVKDEIKAFLKWFNGISYELDGLLRAAIAHFWFVMIHPFDDGNGRITRIITERALASDEKLTVRYYSLSRQILKRRKQYYDVLEKQGKGELDITKWITWFLTCFIEAIASSEDVLAHVFAKAKFWDKCSQIKLNDRQKKVIEKMLDWEKGYLTTKKYMSIVKNLSRITAVRDISDLVKKGILKPTSSKGRSTSYSLTLS